MSAAIPRNPNKWISRRSTTTGPGGVACCAARVRCWISRARCRRRPHPPHGRSRLDRGGGARPGDPRYAGAGRARPACFCLRGATTRAARPSRPHPADSTRRARGSGVPRPTTTVAAPPSSQDSATPRPAGRPGPLDVQHDDHDDGLLALTPTTALHHS